jgi:hypothetical protein
MKSWVELQMSRQQTMENISKAGMGTWQVYRGQSYDSKKLGFANQSFLGRVPHSTQIGDKVCIFLGSAVPNII